MGKKTNKEFSWRAFASVLAAVSFIAMTFTGVILFVVPPGRVANWTGWTLMGLSKHQWIGLHVWFSNLFVVASILHVYLNWKPLVNYFKDKASKAFALRGEWAAAVVVSAAVFAFTLAEVAPFSSLLDWNERIKHSWETPSERAPIPHAELLTLSELAKQAPDVDLDTMLSNLKAKGIEVDSPNVVLGDLAEAWKMTPMQLYDLALGRGGGGRGRGGPGGGRRGQGDGAGQYEGVGASADGDHVRGGAGGPGFGRLTLKQYCDQMGLDANACVERLKKAGFEAAPGMTMRAIADTAGVHPSEVRNFLEPVE